MGLALVGFRSVGVVGVVHHHGPEVSCSALSSKASEWVLLLKWRSLLHWMGSCWESPRTLPGETKPDLAHLKRGLFKWVNNFSASSQYDHIERKHLTQTYWFKGKVQITWWDCPWHPSYCSSSPADFFYVSYPSLSGKSSSPLSPL